MNPEKWESVESLDSSSGVMVSNLPLLFAHGMPTSLQKITLTELEVFVPFMVRCSVGEDLSTVWSQLPRPPWWPSRLPFRLPSARNVLIKLVERCYDYHGCQYLLLFCASLDQMRPVAGYRFTDNRDGTVSMYHGSTGKLLVTFRNENRDIRNEWIEDLKDCNSTMGENTSSGRDSYDSHEILDDYDHEVKPKHHQSLQKKLLPSPTGHHNYPSGNHGSKNDVMVRPPDNDIFLCDKCDDEFSSLKEVQSHERNCKGDRPPTPKIPSPEPELSDDEQDQQDQLPYLAYLGLQPEKHTGIQPYVSPRKKPPQEGKKAFNHSYLRYETVELSSPLGRYILSKSKGGKLQLGQLRYERHVHATPDSDYMSTRERSTNRWVVVFRPRQEDQIWYHVYNFNKDQRQERLATIQYGLNFRSRKLLLKFKKVNVKLKRLAKRTIDRATRLGSRSAPCIDLTISEESFPNQLHEIGQSSQFAGSSIKRTNQGVKSCQSTFMRMNQASKERFSKPFPINHTLGHSIFGSSDNFKLVSPHNESIVYHDPLGQNEDDDMYVNGCYSPGTIILADSHNGSQQILQDSSLEFRQKLWGLGVTVADICDISNSSDECVSSKLNVKRAAHKGESSQTQCTNIKVPINKPGPKSKTSHLRISPIYPIHNSPQMNNNNVNSSSLFSAVIPGNGDTSTGPIEIIELSSDDDDGPNESDSGRIGLLTSQLPPKKEDLSHARSFTKSKNGYSHWLPVESLALNGRESGDSVTNGGTPCSVSSQPFSSPYFFLYTNPKSDSMDYKPSNHLFPGLFPIIKIDRVDFDAISHFNSSLCTDMVHGKRLDDSVRPRIDLDEEVSIKVPLQIDEDTITCCCSTIINKSDYSIDKLYNANDLLPLYLENSELYNRKDTLSTLSDTVNKGIPLLKCYVKPLNSAFCDVKEEKYEEMESSESIDKFKCHSKSNNISDKNLKTSNLKERDIEKVEKKSRCRPEIERLMSDECRELQRRGIGVLRRVHAKKSKMITRRSLDSAVPTLKTRNKFYVISSNNQRNKLKPTQSIDPSSLRLCGDSTKKDTDQFENTNNEINYIRASDVNCNIDENGNSSINYNSRLPFGLTDDKITECKLNYTFNLSQFYKSSERNDKMTKTELVLNDIENSKNKKLKRNRRRLTREIQNLVGDECKELKDLGFHPNDILSTSRLSPSNIFGGSTCFNDPSDLLTPPLSPNRPRRPSLIMSDRKYSPNKKIHENDVKEMSFTGQESVKNMMQSNKRLSRELSKLMKDEWKELKKSGSHPSQIPALLSNQRSLRSYKEPSASTYDRKFGNHVAASKELIFSEIKDSEDWCLSRCTRGQAKMASFVDSESPRAMHRSLIQSMTSMCVVNYDMPET